MINFRATLQFIYGAIGSILLAALALQRLTGLPLVADLRRAALPVQRANRRIIVERGALDIGQGLDIARACVDTLGRASGEAGK